MRNMLKNNKAITLIALVITIVILIILAGVVISLSLGNNGIITKARSAKDDMDSAKLREKAQIELSSIYADYLSNSTGENLLDYLIEYFNNNEWISSVIVEEQDGKNVLLLETIEGYEMKINVDNSTKNAKLDDAYCKKIKYDGKIIYNANGGKGTMEEQRVRVGYNIKLKNNAFKKDGYVFMGWSITENGETITSNKITVENEETQLYAKWLSIEELLSINPNISMSTVSGGTYPILKGYGVEMDSKVIVAIEYSNTEYLKNLYSEDSGNTWKEYIGEFETTASSIKAKSLLKEDETKSTTIVEKKIEDLYVTDALDEKCYDGVVENYGCKGSTQIILVDDTVKNKELRVLVGRSGSKTEYYVNSIANDNTSTCLKHDWSDKVDDFTITIPSNCAKLQFISSKDTYFKEIMICSEPVFIETGNYPLLTSTGVSNLYSDLEIDYFPTSIQKYYSFDGINWNTYTEKLRLNVPTKVYAKSYDVNGKESREISELTTSLISGGLDMECFDNDNSNYGCKGSSQIILVDDSVKNRILRILVGRSGSKTEYYVNSIANDNTSTCLKHNWSDKVSDFTITIPSNCAKLQFISARDTYFKEIILQ